MNDTPKSANGPDVPPELPHTVKQHALTGATVHYECRQCQTALHSKLAEAGERENCPQCGVGFIVPGLQTKTDEAKRLAAQSKATKEADRMKQAAERIERDRRQSTKSTPPPLERPPSSNTRFIVYEIAGALIFLVGLVTVFVAVTSIQEVFGAIALVGGLLILAVAAVGSVLCYCAALLYEMTRLQRKSAQNRPQPPKHS